MKHTRLYAEYGGVMSALSAVAALCGIFIVYSYLRFKVINPKSGSRNDDTNPRVRVGISQQFSPPEICVTSAPRTCFLTITLAVALLAANDQRSRLLGT